jgi:hypothetical protein
MSAAHGRHKDDRLGCCRGLLGWVIWDYRTGRELARLGYKKARHGFAFSPAVVSPDGRRVAIGGGDVLHLYEVSRE